MAKTDWGLNDSVKPDDMNGIGQEINQIRTDLDNIDIPPASLTEAGIVQLSSSTNGTRENVAATEKAVGLAFQSGNERKAELVAALVAKGISATTNETWVQLIAKVTALIKATGNATAADLLSGKAASNVNGPINGTMVKQLGAIIAFSAAKWANGDLAVYPYTGFYASGAAELRVTVAQLQAAEANLRPNNIKNGVNVLGTIGTMIELAYNAGTNIQATSLSLKQTNWTNPMDMCVLEIPQAGTLTIEWEDYGSNSGYEMYTQVFRNGVAFGPRHAFYSYNNIVKRSDTLAFNAGDKMQLRAWISSSTSGLMVYVRNVKILSSPAVPYFSLGG